jgi:hypothetical protein
MSELKYRCLTLALGIFSTAAFARKGMIQMMGNCANQSSRASQICFRRAFYVAGTIWEHLSLIRFSDLEGRMKNSLGD